ncbi:MAG: phospholipid carrier-dependent glycosyltransferase, partial [Armatimonadetes bacterium]|nr:phospholipid carrier-dependent glycosyltransferase [Armatimonadota bacterium]
IAFSIKIFGDNPAGFRMMGVILGSLMVSLLYLLAYEMFKNQFKAVLSALFLALDFLHFVQSRIAALDIYLSFFSFSSFYAFYLYLKNQRLIYLIFSGIFLGMAFSCKWNAILGILAIFIIYASCYKKLSLNVAPGRFLLIYALTTLSFYFFSYTPSFLKGLTFKNFLLYHSRILHFHYLESFRHPYISHFYAWPLLIRPIWYFYKEINLKVQGIIAIGSPFFWYSFLVFFIYLIYQNFKKFNLEYTFLILNYLSLYLFGMISVQGGFFYYMLPCVPWMALISAAALNKIFNKTLMIIYFIIIIMFFICFYPILSAYPIGKAFFNKLIWFRNWI